MQLAGTSTAAPVIAQTVDMCPCSCQAKDCHLDSLCLAKTPCVYDRTYLAPQMLSLLTVALPLGNTPYPKQFLHDTPIDTVTVSVICESPVAEKESPTRLTKKTLEPLSPCLSWIDVSVCV